MSLPASDNFNRADQNPIAGNWTNVTSDAMALASNVVWPGAGSNYAVAYWNADTFGNDQLSQATLGGASISSTYGGPACRIQSGALTAYFFGDILGVYQLIYIAAGSSTVLATGSGTPTAGDVLKLEMSGTGLTGKVNGVSNATATDSALASGQAGLFGYGAIGNVTLDDWSGDNIGGGVVPYQPKYLWSPVMAQ